MGLWSDTGKFLSATGGVLSEGVELLAQGASELERATHRMLLESRIKLMEFERVQLGEGWFEVSNADKHQELLDTYAELIRDYPSESTAPVRAQLDQLHAARRSLTVNKQVKGITELNDRVKSTNYHLTIDAITARKRLIGMLEELGGIASKDEEHGRLLERSRTRIAELKGEIKDLEPKRRSVEITKYPSGANKIKVERFDGKLSGAHERWYQNGKRCWNIPFSAGQIVGNVEQWREDGSRLLEAGFADEMQSFRGFSVDSQLLVKAQIQRPDARMTLCFTELKGISFGHQLGSRPSKIRFALKVMATPKLLVFLWKARKPGPEADRVHELKTLGDRVDEAIHELLAIRKAG